MRLNKILLKAFILVLAVIVAGGTIFHVRPPIIKASNIQTLNNKISSNAPIVFTFNQLMDRTSIEEGFKIFPEIRGAFAWTLNEVTFTPEQKFTVGETYNVTISGSAANIFGRAVGSKTVLNFIVVDPPTVALAVPTGETSIDSRVTVMFGRPMTELTTLDAQESRAFPMTISPELPGRYKWLGTSAFQFIPKERLAYSTEYIATIPAGVRSLDGGVLEAPYTFTFKTPRITLTSSVPPQIPASGPLTLSFNQDVNLESVLSHTKIRDQKGDELKLIARYQKHTEVTYDEAGKKIEKEVIDKRIAELMPKEHDFGYQNTHTLSLEKGVSGVEGNMASESEVREAIFSTESFLTSFFPTGGLKHYDPKGDITLSFDQEIDLNSVRKNFTIVPKVALSIAYGKMCDPKWEPEKSPDEKCPEVENPRAVIITPEQKLKNASEYRVSLGKETQAKNGEMYLKNDVEWSFTTADKFKILRTDAASNAPLSYKQLCIYTNNIPDIKEALDRTLLSFTPTSKSKITLNDFVANPYTEPYQYFPDFTSNYDYYGYDTYAPPPCKPKGGEERYGIGISVLLDPDTSHALKIAADFKDIFGQPLEKELGAQFKTEPLHDRDTKLSFVQPDFFATSLVDQHAAPVLSSQNLSEIDLEVCRLSAEKFIEIDSEYARESIKPENRSRRYDVYAWNAFSPSEENCTKYFKIKQKLKQKYWLSQYMELSVKELIGGDPKPGHYLIRAHSPHVYSPVRAQILLTLTNSHLAVKSAAKSVVLWVTDMTTGMPVKDAALRLYSGTGSAISGSGKTDANGLYTWQLNELPFQYAVALGEGGSGEDSVVVHTNHSKGITPWDFQQNYSPLQRYFQGYVYTERPLYQPNQEVFFKGIVRNDEDTRLTLPLKHSDIEVTITDVRGTSIYNKKLPLSSHGTFSGSLKLDASSPLGRYTIETCMGRVEDPYSAGGYCGEGLFQNFFFVEEYRKPEYKLEALFSKEAYVNKDILKALVSAQYFFGAPVGASPVKWTLRSQNYYFDEYKGEWFSFTDYSTFQKCYFGCPFEDSEVTSGSGTTNADGIYELEHKLDLSGRDAQGKEKAPDASKIYTLTASIQDKNNQNVTVNKEVIVHRGEYYVGVKNDSYIVSKGESMPIKVITVDHKGNPLEGKSVMIEMYKVNWKYVKKKNIDGGFYFENERDDTLVDSKRVTTGESGKASHSFTLKEGGEYVANAMSEDTRGNRLRASSDFYVSTNEVVHWKQENNNRMELKLDKLSYDVGDTALVLVKSPYSSVKALLTSERGDVMSAQVIDVKSNAHVIEVPITQAMIPNFFLSVLEVKGGSKSDPPDFKMGLSNVVVNTGPKKLTLKVTTDKARYEPREKVNLEIVTTDSAGAPVSAEVSVAAVDASLLALKGNPKRDLVGLFYNTRWLGVLTSDNMTNFLQRIDVLDLKGAKGGSGKGADEFAKPRGEFEDTAFWRATLQTGADGKLATNFILPDNLTTWNIEVIGATDDSLFGDARVTVTTQKPVTLRPVLPRFALFGDEIRLGAIVHNFTEKDQSFEVTLEATNLEIKDATTKKIRIEAGGSEKILWDTVVPKVKIGERAELTMSVSGGSHNDSVRQTLNLYPYATPETVATSAWTEDTSFTEKIALPAALIDPDLGSLKIKTGATLATYVSDSLNYLIDFPYGCTEQIMSRIVGSVVLKNAVSLPQLKDAFTLKEIRDSEGKVVSFDTMVSKSLQQLYDSQRSDGGWGYFYESRESYPGLTAYVLYGLHHIKRAGFSVDSGVTSRAANFVNEYMRSNRDLNDQFSGLLRKKDQAWANNRAYMLFVLSEIGSGDIGLPNSLYEDRSLLSNGSKAYLAMTLNSIASTASEKIAELVRELENQARIDSRGTYIRNDIGSSFDMMTNTKVTALTAQMLTRIKPSHALLPKFVSWLIAARSDGHWDTTQDTVTALTALSEYLEQSKELEANYAAKILLDKNSVSEYAVSEKNVLETHEITRPISTLRPGGESTDVQFEKTGKGRLYYDLVLKYFLPVDHIAPRSDGFTIVRNYYSLDDKKLEHPLTEARAGQTVRGHMTVIVPEERRMVSVENFLPAGFELVNFEFENTDKSLLGGPPDGKGGYAPYYSESSFIPTAMQPFPPSEFFGGCLECGSPYQDGYFSGFANWTHKELRHDRLWLFADRLARGVYEYDYYVQVTSEGKFHHPPALVSEMYFPENFGRTKGEWMKVGSK